MPILLGIRHIGANIERSAPWKANHRRLIWIFALFIKDYISRFGGWDSLFEGHSPQSAFLVPTPSEDGLTKHLDGYIISIIK